MSICNRFTCNGILCPISFIMHSYDRYDVNKQSRRLSSNTEETNFSRLSGIKLNKKKKHMLQEQRNTEIDRRNRLLYERIAKCANRVAPTDSRPTKKRKHRHKLNTLPHSPAQRSVSPIDHHQMRSNILLQKKSKAQMRNPCKNSLQVRTLFMGHSEIDGVDFKIKLMIANCMYYLVAENEHSKIILEMPEEEYWELHYKDLKENPCNIFRYLQLKKGRIQFRVRDAHCKDNEQPAATGDENEETAQSRNISELRVKKQKRAQGSGDKVVFLPKI